MRNRTELILFANAAFVHPDTHLLDAPTSKLIPTI